MATDNIYDALRESHERQRSLCRKLVRAKPGTQDRISLFKQLHVELEAHAAAEFGARFAFGECPEHAAGALGRDGDTAICSADAGHCASPLGNAEIG